MPVAHRELGFSFIIYTNDHLPKHIHAFHDEQEAVFYLGELECRVDENSEDVLVIIELPSL